MEVIFGTLVFFGLGLLALVILACSAIWARSAAAVLVWGVIAMLLMALQCFLLNWAAGIGSATSGSQHGYANTTGAITVFTICLVVYVCLVFDRITGR
jgi:hypothetical protein